jgi:predicted alpha/beta-fold hydrolase
LLFWDKIPFNSITFTKKRVIHYTIYENKKNAPWVTFVHGAGGSSSIWFKQIRDFQKQYNVLLLDLIGHGNSNQQIKIAFKQKYTFSALAIDILEVLDHLKIQKSHFVGISLGTILKYDSWRSHSKNEFSFPNPNEIGKYVQICIAVFGSVQVLCFCNYAQ